MECLGGGGEVCVLRFVFEVCVCVCSRVRAWGLAGMVRVVPMEVLTKIEVQVCVESKRERESMYVHVISLEPFAMQGSFFIHPALTVQRHTPPPPGGGFGGLCHTQVHNVCVCVRPRTRGYACVTAVTVTLCEP